MAQTNGCNKPYRIGKHRWRIDHCKPITMVIVSGRIALDTSRIDRSAKSRERRPVYNS